MGDRNRLTVYFFFYKIQYPRVTVRNTDPCRIIVITLRAVVAVLVVALVAEAAVLVVVALVVVVALRQVVDRVHTPPKMVRRRLNPVVPLWQMPASFPFGWLLRLHVRQL